MSEPRKAWQIIERRKKNIEFVLPYAETEDQRSQVYTGDVIGWIPNCYIVRIKEGPYKGLCAEIPEGWTCNVFDPEYKGD